MNVYGPRLAAARKWAGISQETMAEELGVSSTTIKRRENVAWKEPKRVDLLAAAAVTGVSIDYLEGLVDDIEAASDRIARRQREHDALIDDLRRRLAAVEAQGFQRQIDHIADAVMGLMSGASTAALAEAWRVGAWPPPETAPGEDERDPKGERPAGEDR